MTLTFFQSIGDAKKAGAVVLLRQLILFVPAMLILPHLFGSLAVWWAEPAVDFTMILIGFIMQQRVLRKLWLGIVGKMIIIFNAKVNFILYHKDIFIRKSPEREDTYLEKVTIWSIILICVAEFLSFTNLWYFTLSKKIS